MIKTQQLKKEDEPKIYTVRERVNFVIFILVITMLTIIIAKNLIVGLAIGFIIGCVIGLIAFELDIKRKNRRFRLVIGKQEIDKNGYMILIILFVFGTLIFRTLLGEGMLKSAIGGLIVLGIILWIIKKFQKKR